MSKELKKHNSDFKLKVVTKYLSNNYTVMMICDKYNISKATLHKLVKQFKENSGNIFSENKLVKK